jgi:anti-anti-sigma factor
MSHQQTVVVEFCSGVCIISPRKSDEISGEGTFDREWEAVRQRIVSSPVAGIVVDLAKVAYLGSTLLQWLVRLWKEARGRQVPFSVCNASEASRVAFETTNLDTLWRIHASVDEAIQACADSTASHLRSNG